mmetsp:Transcript_25784/g.41438  ORF Transcript_25784/g.41438 Transcript_25784/m.41438 type:complete len:89 (+) Transcript_25784:520-786(+)
MKLTLPVSSTEPNDKFRVMYAGDAQQRQEQIHGLNEPSDIHSTELTKPCNERDKAITASRAKGVLSDRTKRHILTTKREPQNITNTTR